MRGATYGLVYILLALGLCACDVPLLDDLDEPQANDLIVCLSAAGITAEKQGRLGRFAVRVARDDFAVAWRIARQRGLPRQVGPPTGGLLAGPPPGAERGRRAAALAAFLRADPAIADARVVLGDRGAAVSVRAAVPADVDDARIEARVRAVGGLEADEPLAIDVHPLAGASPAEHPPDRAAADQPAPASENRPVGLWLASIAVGLMLTGCGLLAWRMLSGRRTRGLHA